MMIFIEFFFHYKHQSRQQDSPIFIRGFVYQFRSGLESTKVTTSNMTYKVATTSKSSPRRGYQELCQVHFCRTMIVYIAETTVANLIYVWKLKC